MSDFNSRSKIQSYGNCHSLLGIFEECYYALWNIEGVKFVGTFGFTSNKFSREGYELRYDEGKDFFEATVYQEKWAQKFKIVLEKEVKKNLESSLF